MGERSKQHRFEKERSPLNSPAALMQEYELTALRLSRPMDYLTFGAVVNLALWAIAVTFSVPNWLEEMGWSGAGWLSVDTVMSGLIHLFFIWLFFDISRRVRQLSKPGLIANIAILSAIFFVVLYLAVKAMLGLPSFYTSQLASGANKTLLIVLVILLALMALATVFFVLRRWYRAFADTIVLFKYKRLAAPL